MSGIWDRIKGILGWVKREPDKKEDDRVMYIIAGLGNPTREYEKTKMCIRDRAELLPFCQEHGITLQAYSPIEQGLLAGKAGDDYVPSKGNVREGKTWWKPENIAAVNRMLAGWRDLTEKYHCSLANLCIKWRCV